MLTPRVIRERKVKNAHQRQNLRSLATPRPGRGVSTRTAGPLQGRELNQDNPLGSVLTSSGKFNRLTADPATIFFFVDALEKSLPGHLRNRTCSFQATLFPTANHGNNPNVHQQEKRQQEVWNI